MEIRTFDTIYTVIYSKKTEESMLVYLARRESDHELFRLFCLKKEYLREGTIAFLNDQLKNRKFEDFEDVFLVEGMLYVAMRYHTAPSLREKIEEQLEYEERLEIGKNLLEAFLMAQMPPYFMCQCLEDERILVTPSLGVVFDYTLDQIELAHTVKKEDAKRAFADFLNRLWKGELKNMTVSPLKNYVQELEDDKDLSEEDIYRKYLEMQKEVQAIPREERRKPKRWPFRLWDKLKKGIPKFKKMLACLLLLLALGYLGYTIWQQNQPSGGNENVIQYIGTLQIKE